MVRVKSNFVTGRVKIHGVFSVGLQSELHQTKEKKVDL